jgi:hypothetical protein
VDLNPVQVAPKKTKKRKIRTRKRKKAEKAVEADAFRAGARILLRPFRGKNSPQGLFLHFLLRIMRVRERR